jgi:hypothetical protein
MSEERQSRDDVPHGVGFGGCFKLVVVIVGGAILIEAIGKAIANLFP